jgi:phage shock protein C
VQHKLTKSSTNHIFSGVCGGIGEYFDIDPTIIRVIFVILALWGGLGILIYLILLIIMPEPVGTTTTSEEKPHHHKVVGNHHTRNWLGVGLVFFGIMLLFDNLNSFYSLFPTFQFSQILLPLIVIYLGIWFLYRKTH